MSCQRIPEATAGQATLRRALRGIGVTLGALRPGTIVVVDQMAEESWGYSRVQGGLQSLDHQVARSTIAKVLKEPGIWYAPSRFRSLRSGAQAEYLRLHLIPTDPSLWALNRYDDFIEARKALIVDKLDDKLQTMKEDAAAA